MKLNGGYDFPGSNSGIDLFCLTGWVPENFRFDAKNFDKKVSTERVCVPACMRVLVPRVCLVGCGCPLVLHPAFQPVRCCQVVWPGPTWPNSHVDGLLTFPRVYSRVCLARVVLPAHLGAAGQWLQVWRLSHHHRHRENERSRGGKVGSGADVRWGRVVPSGALAVGTSCGFRVGGGGGGHMCPPGVHGCERGCLACGATTAATTRADDSVSLAGVLGCAGVCIPVRLGALVWLWTHSLAAMPTPCSAFETSVVSGCSKSRTRGHTSDGRAPTLLATPSDGLLSCALPCRCEHVCGWLLSFGLFVFCFLFSFFSSLLVFRAGCSKLPCVRVDCSPVRAC